MKEIILLGFGGFIGTSLRYGAQLLVNKFISVVFPMGTFLINISGCFLIGLLYGIALKHEWMTNEWRLFLITGLCGGYTTFSTFSYESVELFRQGHYVYLLLYIFLSVGAGVLATVAGLSVIK